jgi:iron(III) transport system substrate-binding protein
MIRRLTGYACLAAALCGVMLSAIAGCDRREESIVVYTSIDQPIARQVIDSFERQSGLRVTLVTDTEATKSVGLAERLRAERDRPRAQVWWGNEPFHTINLAAEGLLVPYASPAASDLPAQFTDAEHRWAGNGLRARVIAVHGSGQMKFSRLEDLLDPRLRGRLAMARPTAGTTGGHVAALFVLWGDEKAAQFFRDLRANGMKLLGGNGPVAEATGRGTVLAGLTDNDDIHAARRAGGTLEMILPNQDDIGTLMVPTTVALVAGSEDDPAAKQLVDFLLSREVEQMLLDAQFISHSIRAQGDYRAMQVDYEQVARALPRAVRLATAILEGRE